MHRLAPAFDAPALLAADLALLKIGKLPQVVHRIQLADLYEPCSYPFHDFATGLEATPPVCLPFEQVSGMKRVGSKLKKSSKLAWRGCGPKRKLLHERCALGVDQVLELGVEFRKFGMVLDGIQRSVVALVSLVFPDMHCSKFASVRYYNPG